MKIRYNAMHYFSPLLLAFCSFLMEFSEEESGGAGILLAALIVLLCFIHRQTSYLLLEDNMITGKTGLIRVRTLTAPVNKIQYCEYTQVLGMKPLNIIEINAITGTYIFKHMEKAKEFVQLVNSEMTK